MCRPLAACSLLLLFLPRCGVTAADLERPPPPAPATPVTTAPATPPPSAPPAQQPASPADGGAGLDGGPGIFPLFLPDGRTYDQQHEYVGWAGNVSRVRLEHRDQTALPASEGGDACSDGCIEEVTRIAAPGSVWGRFTFLERFNVQVATGPSAGDVTVEACGQVIARAALASTAQGLPGFNNWPVPAWAVPTDGDCEWRVTATRGFVDFRAVTATLRRSPTAAAPVVDVKVNGSDDPLTLRGPAGFTVTWTSDHGICAASGAWGGAVPRAGSIAYQGVADGKYTFMLTCTSSTGTASDSVTVQVVTPQ